MSIKGSKGYCQYCRTPDEKNDSLVDKNSRLFVCKECKAEINHYETLITTMKKRFTPTLEKYLVETCFERSRTNSQDERYKKKILFVTEHKKSILRKLMQDKTKIFEIAKTLQENMTTSPTYYFGHSEVDLLIIQAQREVTNKRYSVSLIGRMELDELLEILR